MSEFPKWKYRERQSVIVENAEEERALGPGWVDDPQAAMAQHAAAMAAKATAELPPANEHVGHVFDNPVHQDWSDAMNQPEPAPPEPAPAPPRRGKKGKNEPPRDDNFEV